MVVGGGIWRKKRLRSDEEVGALVQHPSCSSLLFYVAFTAFRGLGPRGSTAFGAVWLLAVGRQKGETVSSKKRIFQ